MTHSEVKDLPATISAISDQLYRLGLEQQFVLEEEIAKLKGHRWTEVAEWDAITSEMLPSFLGSSVIIYSPELAVLIQK